MDPRTAADIPEDLTADCPLAAALAARMRSGRMELTARWLDRIVSRVSLLPNRVFPSDEILDHMPLLVLGVADYIEDPAHAVATEAVVVAKARELGALRHAQGFDEYEILKEYEILGGVLFHFLAHVVTELDEPCTRAELLVCSHRLFHAVAIIQQATMTHYFTLMTRRLAEREERLRAFNRALTHELRNRLGAALGAAHMLALTDVPLSDAERVKMTDVVVRNVDSMRVALDNLLELTRIDVDARRQRHVRLPQAAAEAMRQVRELARAKGVELRLAGDLPPVEVNAAATELCLTNLLTNAIKYSDLAKSPRVAEVRVRLEPVAGGESREAVIEVWDNGIGVPEEGRGRLFERFFRAHDHGTPGTAEVEGTGLGLSIVRETVESLGGRAWAEFPSEGGSVFAFSVPCRRHEDAAAIENDTVAPAIMPRRVTPA